MSAAIAYLDSLRQCGADRRLRQRRNAPRFAETVADIEAKVNAAIMPDPSLGADGRRRHLRALAIRSRAEHGAGELHSATITALPAGQTANAE